MTLTVVLACSQASADWDPGDSAKWVQLPDLTSTGMDIWLQEADNRALADDFQCTSTDAITDIHIWGSWLGDVAGTLNRILVVIKADDRSGPYSKPGSTNLWAGFVTPTGGGAGKWGIPVLGSFTVRQYYTMPEGHEVFWDPVTGTQKGTDTQVWQINIDIPEENAFVQQGSPQSPLIYWLQLQIIAENAIAQDFGWKTRDPLDGHYEDNAVYFDGSGWQQLIYPAGHPNAGQSIDLAFVITPEPATIVLMGLGTLGTVLLKRKRVTSK